MPATSTRPPTRIAGRSSCAARRWPNHTIEASYLEFDSEVANWFFPGFPVGDLAATNGIRHDPRDSATLSYQGVLTPNLFLELQATEKNETQTIGGQPGNVDPILNAGGGAGGTAVYGNYWWDSTDNSDRDNETQSGILSYHIPGDRAGSHNLEGGVQFVSSITSGRNQQSATGYNYLSLNPDFVAGTNAAGETLFNVRSFAALRFVAQPIDNEQILDDTSLFVQDTIDLGKWRFDLGARWEQYEGDGALAEENVDFDKIVPRLAATYDISDRWQVTGELRAVRGPVQRHLRAGHHRRERRRAGRRTSTSDPDALGITAAQVAQITRTDAFWPLVTFFNGPGIQNNYLADDINMPYADEWGLSVRYALPQRSGTIVLSYVDREYEDLLSDFLGGVCEFPGIFTFQHETETCPGANTTDILGPTGAVINQADTLVWANDPRAVRDYQGLAAQIQWRPTLAVADRRQRDLLEPERQLLGRGGDAAGRRRHARHLCARQDLRRHHLRRLGAGARRRCAARAPVGRLHLRLRSPRQPQPHRPPHRGLDRRLGHQRARLGLQLHAASPSTSARPASSTPCSSTRPSRRLLTATPISTWPRATTCRSSASSVSGSKPPCST